MTWGKQKEKTLWAKTSLKTLLQPDESSQEAAAGDRSLGSC